VKAAVYTAYGAADVVPENVTFEQVACLPVAALAALQGLRDHGQIRSGRVLINSASGGVDTATPRRCALQDENRRLRKATSIP